MSEKFTLINNDCMNVSLPKCKLLLTDIPYNGCNKASNGLRTIDKGKADLINFEIQPFLEHIYNCFDICVIFCGHGQFSEIFTYFNEKQLKGKGTTRQLIWAKSNPSPMNGEYIYLSGTENAVWFKKKGTGKLNCRCKTNVFTFPNGSSKFHPTEKNHKLLADIILDNTDIGDLVVDTCTGSGSTGIVALKNDRNFFGTEIDKGYYKVSNDRLEKTIKEKGPKGFFK